MKIMVMPIGFDIGGSEINAIDLAAAVRERGHDVVVIGRPGPLDEVARQTGLRVVNLPMTRRGRPSPLNSRAISRAIRQEKPDLVHVYEALSCTEAFFGVNVRRGARVPLVATLYGMNVDGFMPRAVPMIAGTRDIQVELAQTRDPAAVHFLDPPVNTDVNRPDDEAGRLQRRAWGVGDDEDLVVIVSRLDIWMKIDSLMDAIDAVDSLAGGRRIRLAVVGDGPARAALEHRAADVNHRHGRRVIDVVGATVDPVPAYQAADVVVGMGTSLLRGMAAGKPAVLAGELGHVRLIEPTSVEPYLRQGFWGMGDGARAASTLAGLIAGVLDRGADERRELGEFGRAFVVERFGLPAAADQLVDIYEQVVTWTPSRRQVVAELLRVPFAVVRRKVMDRLPGRRRGVKSLDTPAELGDAYLSANAFIRRRDAVAKSSTEGMPSRPHGVAARHD
jgi:glycosyltransferase involved in cell wall biosynthesis